RFEGEMPAREILNASRVVQLRPLRAQRRDEVMLATDFSPQLGDALRLPGRLELDFVDVGRSEYEHGDDADVDQAHPCRRSVTSASDGRRGSSVATGASAADASVRSAALSLAERARGLAAISVSSGATGRLVSSRKLAAAGICAGRWREEPPRPLRAARKDLAMRSSSEWNATTTSRPPGFSTVSAAPRPGANSARRPRKEERRAANVRV